MTLQRITHRTLKFANAYHHQSLIFKYKHQTVFAAISPRSCWVRTLRTAAGARQGRDRSGGSLHSHTSGCRDGAVGSWAALLSACWPDCCSACSSSEPWPARKPGGGPAKKHEEKNNNGNYKQKQDGFSFDGRNEWRKWFMQTHIYLFIYLS